jgi:amino acid adenylation domain-containing protein
MEMIVGILAILKAGGVYVPLDPRYPDARLRFILHDSNVRLLLTQETLLETREYASGWGSINNHTLIVMDRDWSDIARQGKENLKTEVSAENLAYVIYTSGSAGTPKAVMVCHRGISNYLMWRCDYFPLTRTDRLLQTSSFSFDDSVWQIFEPLMVGATVVVPEANIDHDIAQLIELVDSHRITAACFVPSMLHVFVEQANLERCRNLRRITTGGESLSAELKNRFFARVAANLYNGYGPTEATIGATFWACERDRTDSVVSIGKPIANTQVYLVDRHDIPVPIGVAGEICIGGYGVARGYLNCPDFTAEKFVPDPFSQKPGARLYKTGDLARYLPDGNIEFLGRLDHQVKIRGFRIELGEIETVLGQHPAIGRSIVLARENVTGEKQLVAYVVTNQEQALTASDLRDFLKAKLPSYMLPATFVFLDSLPLTPNGKVDRRKLPLPDLNRPELKEAFVAPRTPDEEMMAEIWAEILKVNKVGIHDNFFDLGGHSLLATQVISRVRKDFHVDLPLRALFEAPTVAGLTAMLLLKQSEATGRQTLEELVAELETLRSGEAQNLLQNMNQNEK